MRISAFTPTTFRRAQSFRLSGRPGQASFDLDKLEASVAIDNEIYGRQIHPAPLSSELIGAWRAVYLEATKRVGSTLSHWLTAGVNNLISNGLVSIRADEFVDVSISRHGVAECNCHNDCAESQHGGSPELYLL